MQSAVGNVKIDSGSRPSLSDVIRKVNGEQTVINNKQIQTGGTVIKGQEGDPRLSPVTVELDNREGEETVTFKLGDPNGIVAEKFGLSDLSNPTGGTLTGASFQEFYGKYPITILAMNYKIVPAEGTEVSEITDQFNQSMNGYRLNGLRKRSVTEYDEDISAGERNTANQADLNTVTFNDQPVIAFDALLTLDVIANCKVILTITPGASA